MLASASNEELSLANDAGLVFDVDGSGRQSVGTANVNAAIDLGMVGNDAFNIRSEYRGSFNRNVSTQSLTIGGVIGY